MAPFARLPITVLSYSVGWRYCIKEIVAHCYYYAHIIRSVFMRLTTVYIFTISNPVLFVFSPQHIQQIRWLRNKHIWQLIKDLLDGIYRDTVCIFNHHKLIFMFMFYFYVHMKFTWALTRWSLKRQLTSRWLILYHVMELHLDNCLSGLVCLLWWRNYSEWRQLNSLRWWLPVTGVDNYSENGPSSQSVGALFNVQRWVHTTLFRVHACVSIHV